MNNVIIKGSVVGSAAILGDMPPAAFNVESWADDRSPATQYAVNEWLKIGGFMRETVFRPKTRGYWLFVYPATPEGFRVDRVRCYAVASAKESY